MCMDTYLQLHVSDAAGEGRTAYVDTADGGIIEFVSAKVLEIGHDAVRVQMIVDVDKSRCAYMRDGKFVSIEELV